VIEATKQYRTRDGREVRIYAIDGNGLYPVHGVFSVDGVWRVRQWTESGKFGLMDEHKWDLIEVPPERWLNVWDSSVAFGSREEADRNGSVTAECLTGVRRIACLKFREGDGL
jgi:hypothetical protein